MTRPKYPQSALRRGEAANVELCATVTSAGKTKDIAVLYGDTEFSRSAVQAIRKWRFRPVSSHGHLVETTYNVHVRFNPMLREANSEVEIESPRPDPLPVSFFEKAHQEVLGSEIHSASEEGIVPPTQIYSPEPELSERDSQGGRARHGHDFTHSWNRWPAAKRDRPVRFSTGPGRKRD